VASKLQKSQGLQCSSSKKKTTLVAQVRASSSKKKQKHKVAPIRGVSSKKKKQQQQQQKQVVPIKASSSKKLKQKKVAPVSATSSKKKQNYPSIAASPAVVVVPIVVATPAVTVAAAAAAVNVVNAAPLITRYASAKSWYSTSVKKSLGVDCNCIDILLRGQSVEHVGKVLVHLQKLMHDNSESWRVSNAAEHLVASHRKYTIDPQQYVRFKAKQTAWIDNAPRLDASVSPYMGSSSSAYHGAIFAWIHGGLLHMHMPILDALRMNLIILTLPPLPQATIVYHGDSSEYAIDPVTKLIHPQSFWSCSTKLSIATAFASPPRKQHKRQHDDPLPIQNTFNPRGHLSSSAAIIYELHLPAGFPCLTLNSGETEFVLPFTLDIQGQPFTFGYRIVGQRTVTEVVNHVNVTRVVRILVPELLAKNGRTGRGGTTTTKVYSQNDIIHKTGDIVRMAQHHKSSYRVKDTVIDVTEAERAKLKRRQSSLGQALTLICTEFFEKPRTSTKRSGCGHLEEDI